MKIKIRNDIFIIKYQPIIGSFLIVLWSLYYYFSTISTRGGPESVLFIKPLIFFVIIAFIGIIYDSIKIKKEDTIVETKESGELGIFDHRRLFFIFSIILYAILITFFGYVVPSIIFLFAVTFYLGVRKVWMAVLIAFTIPLFFSLLFRYAIKVPIPLWPI